MQDQFCVWKIQISFFVGNAVLENELLKDKVLQEKVGISNLKLFQQYLKICVKLFSCQLFNQADATLAFPDSMLTGRSTPGS